MLKNMGLVLSLLLLGNSCYCSDATAIEPTAVDIDTELTRLLQSKEELQQFLALMPAVEREMVLTQLRTVSDEEREKIKQEIRQRIMHQFIVESAATAVQPVTCTEAVCTLNDLDAAAIDTIEIDEAVLQALEQRDPEQDLQFSFTQKLRLAYLYFSMQAKNAKDATVAHVSEYKKEYIIGASAFTAGAILALVACHLCHVAPTK